MSTAKHLPGIPLYPAMAGMTNTAATRSISFYFSLSNPPADVRRTDRSPCACEHCYQHGAPGSRSKVDIFAWIHQDLWGWNFISFQLYFLSQDTNLSFWTRPSGTAINKTTPAMLFLGPHFHSSDFYWVHYLCWAGWNFLQKQVQSILNFCFFPHRKTPTIIYRQLCHNETMAADTLIC